MEPSPFRTRLLVMLFLVVPIAIGATVIAASIGRTDTALLYVGIPCLLALVIGLLPNDGEGGIQVFQFVTVSMLLVAAFLHEGALCLLIASPLVYGIAYAFYAVTVLVRRSGRRHHALGGLVLVALALEGATPGLRINPEQSVTAERRVAEDCTEFETALARGPQFSDDDRGWLLSLAAYPLPTSASHTAADTAADTADADAFATGTTWNLPMPAGSITTRVAERSTTSTGGSIAFDVVADTARTTRWVTLSDATLAWEQRTDGCHADVRINFVRDLDPSWYFGPIIDVFMSAGADAFLAGLD